MRARSRELRWFAQAKPRGQYRQSQFALPSKHVTMASPAAAWLDMPSPAAIANTVILQPGVCDSVRLFTRPGSNCTKLRQTEFLAMLHILNGSIASSSLQES